VLFSDIVDILARSADFIKLFAEEFPLKFFLACYDVAAEEIP
jgi:hypothetical protein